MYVHFFRLLLHITEIEVVLSMLGCLQLRPQQLFYVVDLDLFGLRKQVNSVAETGILHQLR